MVRPLDGEKNNNKRMRNRSHNVTNSRPRGGAISYPISIKFGGYANIIDLIMPAIFGRDRLKDFRSVSGPTWVCAIHSCSRPYHFA